MALACVIGVIALIAPRVIIVVGTNSHSNGRIRLTTTTIINTTLAPNNKANFDAVAP